MAAADWVGDDIGEWELKVSGGADDGAPSGTKGKGEGITSLGDLGTKGEAKWGKTESSLPSTGLLDVTELVLKGKTDSLNKTSLAMKNFFGLQIIKLIAFVAKGIA